MHHASALGAACAALEPRGRTDETARLDPAKLGLAVSPDLDALMRSFHLALLLLALPLATTLGCAVPASAPDSVNERGAVAFRTKRDGNDEIYLWRDGEPATNLTRHPSSDYGFAWSPDGEQLVFDTDRDGNRDLWVMRSDGSDPRPLTFHDAKDAQPCWSPDGAALLFVSDRDHARGEIYVMRPLDSEPVRLTFNEAYEELPCWSPDGTRIAFSRLVSGSHGEQPNGEIFLMNADGSGARRLTSKPGFDSSPAWSPDGRRIAFHGSNGDSFDIFVIDVADGALAKLTDEPMEFWQPSWTSDGQAVVCCAGYGPDEYDIWILPADGSNDPATRKRLTDHPGRDEAPKPRP